jgi:endonuclease/exonuclease/phosphatase family metal-dependent hydrolase
MAGMLPRPASLRVLTLNVCGFPSQNPAFPSLAVRAARFCQHLESSDVDIVNLQELFSRRHLDTIRPLLPSFPHVVWRRGLAGRPAGGLATFARRPLRLVGYHSYAGIVPRTSGPRFRAWRGLWSAMAGVLITEVPELGLVLANTHLTANKDGDWSAGNRYHGFQRAQLNRLHSVLRRLPGARPAVVTGDFNIASDSPLYPAIVDNGQWHDPFADSDPSTFQAAFLPSDSPPHRIDFLLTRGTCADDPRVVFADPEDGIYLSDHVALSARIPL